MDNLDGIANEAKALEGEVLKPGEGTRTPEEEAAQKAANEATEWAQLPALFGSIVCLAMPELKDAYSPQNCLAWGHAMVPVAQRHGWNASTIVSKLGPWPGLILASLPMVVPTVVAIKARRAAAAAAAAEATGKGGNGNGTGAAPPAGTATATE